MKNKDSFFSISIISQPLAPFCLITAAVIFYAAANLHGFAYNEVFGVDSLSTSPVTVEIIKLIEEDNASAENPARGYHGKGPEFSLGYERVPAEYHTPCSKASWSWNGGSGEWDVSGSYNNYQHRDKKVFPFVFSGFARTKAISPSFSAGFETGLYIPLSDSRDGWSVPFFSTSTSPSTVYNYQTEPSTCSSFYNSDKRKLMVLPVMARLDWDAPGFLNISLGAGVYITHLQIESVTGEMFYAEYKDSDGKTHSPGDVSEYSFWRSENKIIPAAKCALSTHLKVSENSGFKLSFAAAALRKTDFLFQEYNFGGNSFRDGVVIGGMSYGFSAAWKILF